MAGEDVGAYRQWRQITERTFGPLKALREKTTEKASCIVNRCRTHQATAGNPCLPGCRDIYVSGVMETKNCSRRSALKTMLAGTAAGLDRKSVGHGKGRSP